MRLLGRLLLAASAAVLSGCAFGQAAANEAKVAAQAQAALAQWADAVAAAGPGPLVFPVGELTGMDGTWEPDVGDNNKPALMAGMVFTNGPLSEGPHEDGVVTWPDGTTTSVPIIGAQEAIVAIGNVTDGACGECKPLIATDATLIEGPIETSRGPAVGPIWSFDIEGTDVKVTRVAIGNAVTVPSLPWDPLFTSIGLDLQAATGSAAGTEVTVSFTGAPDPGNKPCGEDYTAVAVESDLAIVVLVTRHGGINLGGGCTAVGARRTATATLEAPLGNRVVLRVTDGQPVPTIILP